MVNSTEGSVVHVGQVRGRLSGPMPCTVVQFASTDSVGRLGTKQCMAQLLVQSDHDICNNLFAAA